MTPFRLFHCSKLWMTWESRGHWNACFAFPGTPNTSRVSNSHDRLFGLAKDAGQMAVAWAQYRAQEDLVAVSEKYDVKLTLFHGRGGTVGRGGAPAREAILSQPPGSVKGSMRVTEQGEVIRFKYGSAALALNSLDLTLSATIEATLLPPPKPMDNWRRLMDRMADVACNSYRAVVQQDPNFVAFFNRHTGERTHPAALAVVRHGVRSGFSWYRGFTGNPLGFRLTQKRLMLPAWLGSDEVFSQHMEGKDLHVLKKIAEWPFFQTQLGMLEMVLSKYLDIAGHYDGALELSFRPSARPLINACGT